MFEDNNPACWRDPKWYVLFVRSNQEKKVADALAGRNVEHYLPCYASVRQWKDRRVKLEVPLFPGYIFTRLSLNDRLKALTVPNVVSLVGTSQSPSEISPDEMQWIRQATEHGAAQPHPYLNEGDRVTITCGVMSGMQGIMLRRQNGIKVVISVDSIFRAFVVEVDESWVRPIHSGIHLSAVNQRSLLSAAH